ncbi:polysaccharide pyruvyl transferase family protein [Gramella aestuarii]|uniref:Polysaccharide pyruvyl transferase family protein n=2 Tax=Christiangramia aestuarii TaxID=1028746 RepID=A0A7K1LMQ7_9FLAO|nr:polysaccharide pyruvyl transferase family protein [Christiangramia aestuarii]
MGKQRENYGDLLSKYIVEKISEKTVEWVQPKKQSWFKRNKKNYLSTGSIIHHATEKSVVWGSGIIDNDQLISKATFLAVRGPQTRKYLLNFGYECPEVYGDPALLLPSIYNPNLPKRFSLGIIPHYQDYEMVREAYKNNSEIKVIDLMTNDIESVTDQILVCERTISSSLHGLIVSHAYAIPSLWVKFSNKIFGNDIKYYDYLQSVNVEFYEPIKSESAKGLREWMVLIESYPNLPRTKDIENIKEKLLESCPFTVIKGIL